jgi:hypothetical protein
MTASIEQIANRANELSGSMSHGQACYAACQEFEIVESELASTASIVSTVLTNREISRDRTPETAAEKTAREKRIAEKAATNRASALRHFAFARASSERPGCGRNELERRVAELLAAPAWVAAMIRVHKI